MDGDLYTWLYVGAGGKYDDFLMGSSGLFYAFANTLVFRVLSVEHGAKEQVEP